MFAVAYISDFSLQAALRFEPELRARPVALIDPQVPKAAVFQLTPAASAAGVNVGMTSTQALARCPAIVIKTRSLGQERAAHTALLHSAYSLSPSVEATADGICTLDLKGWKSFNPENVGEKLIELLTQFELNAQVGVAATPSLALHAARCASPFLVVKEPAAFLAELPIESLDASDAILVLLKKWGIHTVGKFVSLGRNEVIERLGTDALPLFERASPDKIRPLHLAQPPETFEEAIEFENAIESLEPLLFILRHFLDQISRRLELAHLVAEELTLRLILSDGSNYEQLFHIPAPTRQVDVLFRMLHTHLESLRTKQALAGLLVWAKPCSPQHKQFGLFETALRDPNHFYETLARLTALLGPDRAGTPIGEDSYRPDAFRMEPVDFERPVEMAKGGWRMANGKWQMTKNGGWEMTNSLGLALRRFRPPLPAIVETNERKPVFFHTTKVKARVQKAEGPWRSSGNWWDRQSWQRDEWDVQTNEGELYRLFQEGEHWFLEGRYD